MTAVVNLVETVWSRCGETNAITATNMSGTGVNLPNTFAERSIIKQAVRLGGRHNMPPPRDFDF